MSTKRQKKKKRITRQIRIDVGLHRLLKIAAAEEGLTVSKLADEFLGERLRIHPRKTSFT